MRSFLRILIIIASLFFVGVGIVLYIVYNSDPAQQEVLEEQSFDEEIGAVEVTVENSRVVIMPSADETIRVVMSGNDDNFTLNTEIEGGRLAIEVEDRSPFFNFDFNRSYTLQVYLPVSGLDSLSADSNNGSIEVNGITTAEAVLEADNGRITLEAVDSESVDVETNNGRVELKDMEADISVRSSNGRILFSDVSGDLEAQANNGRIELETEMLDFPVDFDTDNGQIEIRTSTEPSNARIEARVDNGNIDVYGRENEETVFGNGEVLIQLASNNGSITVE
ncbi:DUF4097 domain-containing protein [Planococcus sp. CP5-4]|uniref:DUF4097 family beta strand repeat-containing protein n=1 Tax=unclassified Planococcus (in: firmicutes) TaxID=2662419 RepID=UPI001C24856F|nr:MULTISPECIES: DUF4097 family beta strand repeat-containing protein [unclassified Planococcus (in: firmicutes)]MBU9673768.1 DUF4097 domain-containing protein [Planococcus sp. CP5-4_YE]MBV0908892.1 DUF4097 domain-containing protein [Planococcus sp. CP5-4_UN]MBW6063941.1 DUF4097 domain-containing protein [Planococcus sp. CP5-4]